MFISDDYGTRFNTDRIAFVRPWGDRARNINVHFSGTEDDYTMARFSTEENAERWLNSLDLLAVSV